MANLYLVPTTNRTETHRSLEELAQISDAYTRNYRDFLRWLDTTGKPFDFQAVVDYCKWLNEESGYSASTICVRRAAVKRRLRQYMQQLDLSDAQQYAEHQRFETHLGRLDTEPETRAPKQQATSVDETKIVTSEEFWKMKACCSTPRQLLLIRFLYSTGVRVSEACGIKIGHCKHLGDGTVRIRILGKGRKQRDIRISETLFDEIVEAYGGEQWLFETSHGKALRREYASGVVRKIAKKALGRSFGAHTLRHSFVTKMIKKTNAVEAVSRYIGHASTAITLELYCHRTLGINDLLSVEDMED